MSPNKFCLGIIDPACFLIKNAEFSMGLIKVRCDLDRGLERFHRLLVFSMLPIVLPFFKGIHSLFLIRVQKFRYVYDAAIRSGSTATLSSSRDHDVRSQTHTIMGIHRLVDFLE